MSNRVMPKPLGSQGVSEVAEVAGPVEVVSPRLQGIMVRALRTGWYKHIRRKVGQEFLVDKMEMVGSWMKCLDPKVEALHQKMMKEVKEAKKQLLAGK